MARTRWASVIVIVMLMELVGSTVAPVSTIRSNAVLTEIKSVPKMVRAPLFKTNDVVASNTTPKAEVISTVAIGPNSEPTSAVLSVPVAWGVVSPVAERTLVPCTVVEPPLITTSLTVSNETPPILLVTEMLAMPAPVSDVRNVPDAPLMSCVTVTPWSSSMLSGLMPSSHTTKPLFCVTGTC